MYVLDTITCEWHIWIQAFSLKRSNCTKTLDICHILPHSAEVFFQCLFNENIRHSITKWSNASFPRIVALLLHHKYNWIQCVRIWWLAWSFLTNLGFVQVCAFKTLGFLVGRLYLEIDITLQIHLMQVKAWYEKEWMETSKSSIYPTPSEHLVPLASQNWSCLGPDSSLTFSPSSTILSASAF